MLVMSVFSNSYCSERWLPLQETMFKSSSKYRRLKSQHSHSQLLSLLQSDYSACRKPIDGRPNHQGSDSTQTVSRRKSGSYTLMVFSSHVGNNMDEDLSDHITLCHTSYNHDLCIMHHCSWFFALTSVTSGFGMAILF